MKSRQLRATTALRAASAATVDLALQWPYLGNRGWFVEFAGAAATELYTQFWLDKSKLGEKKS